MKRWFHINGGIHLGSVCISGSAAVIILVAALFSLAVYKIDNANTAKSDQTSHNVAVLAWTQCEQTRTAVGAANDRWEKMKVTLTDSANLLDQLAATHSDGTADAERGLAAEWRVMSASIFRYTLQDCGDRP